tara:strand:+ start:5532 stop:8012 length:2481 start_codon:yes stop_codon:yes gene_type:complete
MRDHILSKAFPCLTLLLLLLLWSLAIGSALAQSADKSLPSAGAASSAATEPIPIRDILIRAEEEQQRLEWANRLLAAPDPVEPLSRALAEIADPIDAKLRSTTDITLRDLPIMRLESLLRHWEFDAHRLERWEARAKRALAPYADSALQLAQHRAAWATTRAQGSLDNLPPSLSERVNTVLAQIDSKEAALGTALTRHFNLTQRASELKARIRAGRNNVAAAIDDIDLRLLQIDSPPLWQSLGVVGNTQSALNAMDRGLDIESEFASEYHAAGTGNQQALRVIQIILLPLIIWLFMRSRKASAAASAPGNATVALRRPISTWILLSMLSVLILEPDAPLLTQEFALLIALIPVLRLLPAGTLRALGVWPYVAIALYGIDRVGMVLVADAGWYRLFLLMLNVLALGLSLWLLRHPLSRATAESDKKLQRLLRPLGWTVVLILFIAAICNVSGNVSLAEILTSGVIDSGYMALLLYTGVTACLGIANALVHQPELAQNKLLRRHGAIVQAGFKRLLMLVAFAGWLLYTLDRLRLMRPLREAGGTVLGYGIQVGEVSIVLGDVLVFLFSTWLAYWAARAVRRLLRDELPGSAKLPRGVGNSIASLSYYGVLILGILVALSAAGFKLGQLALVFGALGVGIGFGLQNVVSNFVSGLVLMFERPIQPGDIVDAAGSSGTVREIGLRSTTIRTFDGADVVVPNGLLLSGNLTNWTMFDRSRRFEINVGVAYGSDPAQVLAILNAAARDTPGVSVEPAPMVLMTGYGDSALNFIIRAWTNDIAAWGNVRSDLLARALAALQAAGISIPYNQMDLHLRTLPESMEKSSLLQSKE